MKIFKTMLCLCIIGCCSILLAQAQQLNLFNKSGEPTAYIDFDKDGTIFKWDGTAMAFLKSESGGTQVIGFNGRLLGWYEDGILYDKQGKMSGVSKDHYIGVTSFEPMKNIQQFVPIKPINFNIDVKPIFFNFWSSTSLGELLYFGKNN